MQAEALLDVRRVRRAVGEIAVVVVEGHEVDGDLRGDLGAGVQQDAVDHQGGDHAAVVGDARGDHRLAGVPDRAGQHASAAVDRGAAGVLHGVVGAAKSDRAVGLESESKRGIVGDRHRDAVGHAFAVGPLAASGDVDQVVAVLVVDHRRVGGVGAAAARGVEVDRAAVVVGVAAVADVHVDREGRLVVHHRVRGVLGQREVAHEVRVQVGVDLGPLEFAGVGGVVEDRGGAAGAGGHAGGRVGPGLVVDVEPAAADLRGDRGGAGGGHRHHEVAVGVGVDDAAVGVDAGVGQTGAALRSADVRADPLGGVAAHRAGDVVVQDQALLMQDPAGRGVRDVEELPVVLRLEHAAALGLEANRKAGLGQFAVGACEDDALDAGDLGLGPELVEGEHRELLGIEIAGRGRGGGGDPHRIVHGADVRGGEHQREAGLVADEQLQHAGVHGDVGDLLRVVDAEEPEVPAVLVPHDRLDRPLVRERALEHQFVRRDAEDLRVLEAKALRAGDGTRAGREDVAVDPADALAGQRVEVDAGIRGEERLAGDGDVVGYRPAFTRHDLRDGRGGAEHAHGEQHGESASETATSGGAGRRRRRGGGGVEHGGSRGVGSRRAEERGGRTPRGRRMVTQVCPPAVVRTVGC